MPHVETIVLGVILSAQTASAVIVGKTGELAANRQFYDYAPSAQHQFGRNQQQFVAAYDRLGVAALVLEHPHKQAPKIGNYSGI
jgi:hypothetical protein